MKNSPTPCSPPFGARHAAKLRILSAPRRFSHRGHILLLAILLAGAFAAAPAVLAGDPITPTKTVVLFDGKAHKELSPFYTWTAKYGHEDPHQVFTVVDQIDGAPAIRISGQDYGGIMTREQFANYKLVAEFRWGLVTWEPRTARARDSGILIHGQGPDGNAAKDFKGPWLRSIEYQIIEGGTGDIILVNGYEPGSDQPIAPRVMATVQPGKKVWDPNGTPTEFLRARIDWQFRDPEWKDVLGFRGAKDVEKPHGQWNHIEAICDGGNLTYYLNGVKVNEVRDGAFKAGKLLFQSEGAEIYFRRIELQPLPR